jgi:hypothetical protein
LLDDISGRLAGGGNVDEALDLSRTQRATAALFDIVGNGLSSPDQRSTIAVSVQ